MHRETTMELTSEQGGCKLCEGRGTIDVNGVAADGDAIPPTPAGQCQPRYCSTGYVW